MKKSTLRVFFSVILLVASSLILSSICLAETSNLEVDIPSSYHSMQAGQDIWFTIKFLNLANQDRVDVTLKFDMLDSKGNLVATNTKTVAVETQASFVANLDVPTTEKSGEHLIMVTMTSPSGVSSARASFIVTEKDSRLTVYYIAGAIVIILLVIFFIIKSKPLLRKMTLRTKVDKIVKDKLKDQK